MANYFAKYCTASVWKGAPCNGNCPVKRIKLYPTNVSFADVPFQKRNMEYENNGKLLPGRMLRTLLRGDLPDLGACDGLLVVDGATHGAKRT